MPRAITVHDHVVDRPHDWADKAVVFATEAPETTALLASVQALPLFFGGWIALGLGVTWLLIRQGHPTATAAAVGVGLGPIALLVLAGPAARRRVAERRRRAEEQDPTS